MCLAAPGCAGVRVYSDPALRNETGVKVYAPKPYLLVARTGAKDSPVELSVVYLPDAKDVLYVKQQRGWGSNDLNLKFRDGMLTEFGTKTDSKVPESLEAAGSLLSAAAGAYRSAIGAPSGGRGSEQPEPAIFELYEIVQESGRTRLVRVQVDVR